MNKNKAKRKLYVGIALIVILAVTIGVGSMAFANNGADAIRVNASVADIHIKLDVTGYGADYAITNDNGIAEFENVFTYLNETLGWGNTDTAPDVTEVEVKYEVNFPNLTIAERHAASGGNARYTGTSGSFVVKPDNYMQVFTTEELDTVDFLSGKVMAIPFGKTKDEATAATGIKILYSDGKNNAECISEASGVFEFIPDVTLPVDDNASIKFDENESYMATDISYSQFADQENILYINEKFVAKAGEHFTYGKDIIDGYVKTAGTYEVKALDGNTLSTNKTEFTNAIELEIASNGTVPTVYVKDAEGNISQPIVNILRIDNRGPIITKIQTEKDENLTFKDFGIFTNTDTVLSLDVTISDDGCGAESLYLIEGSGNEQRKIIPTTSEKKSYGITATFDIAFTEDYSKQLSIVSVDRLGNESTLVLLKDTQQSSTLNMESEKPVMSEISVSGTASEYGWYNDEVSFSLTTSDAKSGLNTINISVNGTTLKNDTFDTKVNEEQSYSVILTKELIASLANSTGSYHVVAMATDNAGNVISKEVTIYADIVAPNLSFDGIKEGEIYKRNTPVYINCDEKHYTEKGFKIYVVSNGSEEDYEMTNKVTLSDFTGNGQYQIKAYAKDAAGNTSAEISLNFTVDDTAPVITVKGADSITPSVYGWYNSPLTYKFDVTDNLTGVRTVSAAVNGQAVSVFNNSISITKELIENTINDNGTYEIKITATDNAGNEATSTNTIKVDLVSPIVSLSGIANGSVLQGSPVITITNTEKHYTENGAGIVVDINGTTTTYDKANSLKLSSFGADGHYTVKVYAKDAAGNTSATETVSFTVDNTAPAFQITGPNGVEKTPYGWYNAPFTYEYSVSDNISGVSSVTATINGKAISASMKAVEFTKEVIESYINENGTYELVLYATDGAGNKVSYTETLKIDIVSPQLSVSGAEEGVHYNSPVTLKFENNEKHYFEDGAYMQIAVSRDGKLEVEKKYDRVNVVTFSDFKRDGDYTVKMIAYDAAGNISEESKISFVKDTTAPVIKISGVKEGSYYNKTQTVSVEVNERYYDTNKVNVLVYRTLDGIKSKVEFPWKNKEKSTLNSKSFKNTGTYEVVVSATDEAGNVAKEKKISFTVDCEPPVVNISGVTDKIYTYDDVVAPVITYSDSYLEEKTISIKRAGIDWSKELSASDKKSRYEYANFKKVRENDGIYSIEVTVYDKARNKTTKRADFAVNRFGSSFTYNDAIKDINGAYVQEVSDDFVIEERNVSDIAKVQTEIKLDNKDLGVEADSSLKKVTGGINVYEHILDKSYFEKEGVYQINIMSKDVAGNEAESKEFAGEVKFFVDRTAPVINASGIEAGLVNTQYLSIKADARDNLSTSDISATINGEPVTVTKNDNGIEFIVGEGLSQVIAITAVDKAGNSVTIEKVISVIPNKALYFVLDNKVALAAGGGIAVVLAIIFTVIAKKRKKK